MKIHPYSDPSFVQILYNLYAPAPGLAKGVCIAEPAVERGGGDPPPAAPPERVASASCCRSCCSSAFRSAWPDMPLNLHDRHIAIIQSNSLFRGNTMEGSADGKSCQRPPSG